MRLPWPSRGALALAVALALSLAALVDAPLAGDAARAPGWLLATGRFVTAFGTSGYMLTGAALVVAAAVAGLRSGREMWRGRSLRRLAERASYVFASVAGSGLLAQAIKHLLGRARPSQLVTEGPFGFHPLSVRDAFASFPSGHTTSAFAAAVALAYAGPHWRGALLAFAFVIGLSRVLVGAHYPSDVVGGAALGAGTSLALARGFARRNVAFASRHGRPVMEPLNRSG